MLAYNAFYGQQRAPVNVTANFEDKKLPAKKLAAATKTAGGFVEAVPFRVFRNGTGTPTIEANHHPTYPCSVARARSMIAVISIMMGRKKIPHDFGVFIASMGAANKENVSAKEKAKWLRFRGQARCA